MTRFAEPTKPRDQRLMDRARQRNVERDDIDRANGFGVPGSAGPSEHVRTAMMTLSCAMNERDWDLVAEALALLQDWSESAGA